MRVSGVRRQSVDSGAAVTFCTFHMDRKENAQDHSVKPTEAPQRGSKDEFIFPAEHGTPVAEGRPRALEQVLTTLSAFLTASTRHSVWLLWETRGMRIKRALFVILETKLQVRRKRLQSDIRHGSQEAGRM